MAETDFERICAAYWNTCEVPMGADPWPPSEHDVRDCRRGMAAALREMQKPSEEMRASALIAVTTIGGWQAMIDALLAQAEDREAAQ